MTDLERRDTGAKITRPSRRNRRWPAVIGGLVIAALKSEAVLKLLIHRHSLIAVTAALLLGAVLRIRPVGTAAAAALLVALVLGAHSLGLGLALGFGGFALLMTLFFAISAVLHLRQDRASRASRG